MHAADRAERRAPFRRQELAPDVVDRVRRERHAGAAALLRAPVHQPVLADVEVARAGAALPVVRLAVGEVHLEAADAGVEVLEHLAAAVDPPHHVVEDRALVRAERLEQAGAVVDDADRGREAELRARWLIVRASSGFLMPPPTTELMLMSKSAYSASHCSFLSRSRRLFFETSSGSTLSMLICR